MEQEIVCRYCAGSSRVNGRPCPICEARGQVIIKGEAQLVCTFCTGSARVGDDPCEICGGIGFLDQGRQPLQVLRRSDKFIASATWMLDAIKRAAAMPPAKAAPPLPPAYTQLIAPSRIDELRGCVPANLDFRKLIRLCEEINICAEKQCWYAVAMLIRAILDHLPPVFRLAKFEHVVANYAGGRSFKETMEHLQETARKIADAHLHERMRPSEVLPTPQQVNCGQQLDILLAEIVRITPKASAANP